MKNPPIPSNEADRLKELYRLKLLDNLPDEDLDLITKLASDICGTKVSLVTLIDTNTQVFKSKHGTELEKTSRDIAFCSHAINTPDKMLIVNDATQDERFKDNPLVTEQPHIAFYAGMPLSTKDGLALGTLCVLDSKPKVLSASQIESLKSLFETLKISHPKQLLYSNPIEGLPKRLWQSLLDFMNINQELNWSNLSKLQIHSLAKEICAGEYHVNGKSTFKDEFVTAGGVDLKEIDFKTFQSKLHNDLYFVGEVLNIDAVTGGFNFQNAWTSSYVCAKQLSQS